MDRSNRRPRVGHIQFLNCLPIYWGLVRSGALLDVDLTKADPDRLNDMLVAGDLDIGPISVVEYLRHADDLELLPHIAVGSRGQVLSVNLVSQRPLGELDGRPVALGSTSRTSVLLAQMWLREVHGVKPNFFTCPPDLGAMMREADAAVLIGDVALRATYEAPALGLEVHDLGQAWFDWSGLPMVFAVWAARRDYAAAHPKIVEAVWHGFLASRAQAAAHPREVAEYGAKWDIFPVEVMQDYYRALDFEFATDQVAGLVEFARRAAAAGAVPAYSGPRFITDEPPTVH